MPGSSRQSRRRLATSTATAALLVLGSLGAASSTASAAPAAAGDASAKAACNFSVGKLTYNKKFNSIFADAQAGRCKGTYTKICLVLTQGVVVPPGTIAWKDLDAECTDFKYDPTKTTWSVKGKCWPATYYATAKAYKGKKVVKIKRSPIYQTAC